MDRGVSDGYRERLFEGRYPVALLFMDIAFGDLDVNIHPNKREVLFDDEKEVERLYFPEGNKRGSRKRFRRCEGCQYIQDARRSREGEAG